MAPAGQASQLPFRGFRENVAAGHVEHIAASCWTWPVVQVCTWTIFHAAGTCKFRCVQSFDSMGVWLVLSCATASVPRGLKHASWQSQTCHKLVSSRPCKDEMRCVTWRQGSCVLHQCQPCCKPQDCAITYTKVYAVAHMGMRWLMHVHLHQ